METHQTTNLGIAGSIPAWLVFLKDKKEDKKKEQEKNKRKKRKRENEKHIYRGEYKEISKDISDKQRKYVERKTKRNKDTHTDDNKRGKVDSTRYLTHIHRYIDKYT